MSFPFETAETVAVEETVTVPKEYEVNFLTGRLTRNRVEGAEAVRVWVYNALRTPRYRYPIFSWDYGHELEKLMDKGYTQGYLEGEIKRMVEDCLSVNEFITGTDNFAVSLDKDKLSVSFTVSTLFGEVEISV